MKKDKNIPETGDPFLDSLYDYTPDKRSAAASKKAWMPRLLRWGALAVCLAVLIGSVANVVDSLLGYQEAGSLYDSIADIWKGEIDADGNMYGVLAMGNKDSKNKATADFADAQTNSNGNQTFEEVDGDSETLMYIKAKLGALRAQNSDLAGWITIPNTRIDYPLVHTTDNDYYLTHAFDHSYLAAGSIFMDYRNSKDLSANYNTVIYGHNMMSGAMFASVANYFSRSYFDENRYIYIYTEEGIYVYQVFNIHRVRTDKDLTYVTTYFETGEDFVEFCNTMKSRSAIYVDDVTFNENDRIITLSTCTNVHEDERYCLQAKLVEIQK